MITSGSNWRFETAAADVISWPHPYQIRSRNTSRRRLRDAPGLPESGKAIARHDNRGCFMGTTAFLRARFSTLALPLAFVSFSAELRAQASLSVTEPLRVITLS